MKWKKKRINHSSKRIPNRLFNYVSFEDIHLNLIKLLFYNNQDLPYNRTYFRKDLLKQRKEKNKRGRV